MELNSYVQAGTSRMNPFECHTPSHRTPKRRKRLISESFHGFSVGWFCFWLTVFWPRSELKRAGGRAACSTACAPLRSNGQELPWRGGRGEVWLAELFTMASTFGRRALPQGGHLVFMRSGEEFEGLYDGFESWQKWIQIVVHVFRCSGLRVLRTPHTSKSHVRQKA